MRVMIGTGGTGGHIYPAIALADAVMKEKDGAVFFVGTDTRMESRIIPQLGYPYLGLDLVGFNGGRGNSHNRLESLLKIRRGRKIVEKKIDEFKPDIVIGFGNYVSVPVIEAGVRKNLPTMIHEQNSIAGMANKFLAHIADKVIICYPGSAKDFPKKKTLLLGNPRASLAARTHKDPQVLKNFGLDPDKPTVLVVMGSLGASTVNQKMKDVLRYCRNESFQILYVTGEDGYETFIRDFTPADNIRVVPYIEQLPVMADVDLIVCRGGATSASEIMAMGLPAIVIPSPYVPNNHQHYNALAMVEAGCAIEVNEDTMDAGKLADQIKQLVSDPLRLQQMRKNAAQLGFPDATDNILTAMKTLIEEKKHGRMGR